MSALTALTRQQIAALRKACDDALAFPGNPAADERGVALLDAIYHFTECDAVADLRDDLLRDLDMDEDGNPLDDQGFLALGETMHDMQRSIFNASRGVVL